MYSENEENYNNENGEEISQEYSNENTNSNSKMKLGIVIALVVLVVIIIGFIFLKGKNGDDGPNVVPPNLIISSTSEVLAINNNVPLKAAVTNFQNAILEWTSSNPEVATVDNYGTVKAVGYGKATITVTYLHTDNVPYTATCEVTVADGNPNVPITNVSFQKGEVMIGVGNEFYLPVIIEPTNGYVTNVKYETSDENIVTVDNTGKIKAIKEGKAKISLNYNEGLFLAQINVNVVNGDVVPQIFIPVESIKFKDKLLKLDVGKTQQIDYEILPQDALTSYLTWESADPTIATVSNGIITALKAGTTEITLTSIDGANDTMTLEVVENNIPVEEIKPVGSTTINLTIGQTSVITTTITPDNATNKKLEYTSNNTKVATVDENGKVTAVANGIAYINVKALGGVDDGKENNNYVNKDTNTNTNTGSSAEGNIVGDSMFSSDRFTAVKIPTGTKLSYYVAVVVGNISSGSGSGGNSGVSSGSSSGSGKLSLNSEYIIEKDKVTSIKPTLPEGYSLSSCSVSLATVASVSYVTGKDGKCNVKGASVGSTTLTIVAKNGSGNSISGTTKITVPSVVVPVAGISINSGTKTTLKVNESTTLSVTIVPSNATIKTVTYKTSNSKVATVDNSGKITGVGEGKALISVQDSKGVYSANIWITVVKDDDK